ncbi:hypothetical protein DFO67_10439 [Modicisalibacter xianhensis]|uniref:Uncharacterized protein n=1 Tax=Modicisalibacter xianhensis TaxID=442341 RepID=A0A4R8FVF1_9GAMM|nr:hypothetical protein DFO67_10439 [Halomonas xianhensis]
MNWINRNLDLCCAALIPCVLGMAALLHTAVAGGF